MNIYQITLRGRESSRKGVRYRALSASEVDKITLDAAASLDADAAGTIARVTIGVATRNLGVRRMIVAITKDAVTPAKDANGKLVFPALSDDALWRKVDASFYAELTANWDAHFSASDDAMLVRCYTDLHTLSEGDVDDILGEALQVTTD